MPKTIIRRKREITGIEASDGATVYELFTQECQGIEGIGMATGSLLPGREAVLHYHLVSEEVYYIISGTGKVQLGEEEFTVEAGDAVYIPINTWHALANLDNTEPLEVLCISVPPFTEGDFLTV